MTIILMVFDPEESIQLTISYGLPALLPEYKLLALLSWDDLAILSPWGEAFSCPCVPAIDKYFKPFNMSALSAELKPDKRFAGRVKWYITPMVFGGDPQLGTNTIWVTVEEHAELVKWWNQKYCEVA